MKRGVPAYLRLFGLGLVLLLSVGWYCGCQAPPAGEYTPVAIKPYLACRHYDERGFSKATGQAQPYDVTGRLVAATTPHFLPVMAYTANLLTTLAAQEPACQTIYVLAPNHAGTGLPLIVADRGWETPFGNLEVDEQAVATLLHAPLLADKIELDYEHLQSDHSAATLMPFIKYYLPEAQVVTILLGRSCALEQLAELARLIYAHSLESPVFVLGSIDFSHYLPPAEAAQRDLHTYELIQARDLQALKSLDDGNMDSPETMVAILSYLNHLTDTRVEQLEYTLLPESELHQDTGYSYHMYGFMQE